MSRKRLLLSLAVLVLLVVTASVVAQMAAPARTYSNGSVWNISFIRMKPGMDSAYLSYVATDWKREQDALRQEGLALSYRVIQTEAHSPTDWNLMLMTEYKDLASMEAGQTRADAVLQRVIGSDETQRQGYRNRADMREVLGTRVAREIRLVPETTAR
ncbi:MAG: hypothetical protein M3041_10410 [Acidobacteriota bacterium]|nr:hypothetical protein [Acidobacteriota bacterium]